MWKVSSGCWQTKMITILRIWGANLGATYHFFDSNGTFDMGANVYIKKDFGKWQMNLQWKAKGSVPTITFQISSWHWYFWIPFSFGNNSISLTHWWAAVGYHSWMIWTNTCNGVTFLFLHGTLGWAPWPSQVHLRPSQSLSRWSNQVLHRDYPLSHSSPCGIWVAGVHLWPDQGRTTSWYADTKGQTSMNYKV